MLTVEEIENISFRRSGIGGYKVEDVDTFVDGVIEKVRQQERTNQELEARIEQLNRQIIEHEAKAQAVQDALITAEATAKKLVREAAAEAESITGEARAQADKTISEAEAKSTLMLSASELRARTILNSALARSAAGIDENNRILAQQKQHIIRIQTEVTRFRDALIDAYKNHLQLINALPKAEEFHQYQEKMEETYQTTEPVRPAAVEQEVQAEADRAVEEAKKETEIHVEMVDTDKIRAISEEIRTNRSARAELEREQQSSASLEDTIELPKLSLTDEDDSADSNLNDIQAAVLQEPTANDGTCDEPVPMSIDEMMFHEKPEEEEAPVSEEPAVSEEVSAQAEASVSAEEPVQEKPAEGKKKIKRQPIVFGKKQDKKTGSSAE